MLLARGHAGASTAQLGSNDFMQESPHNFHRALGGIQVAFASGFIGFPHQSVGSTVKKGSSIQEVMA